MDHCRSSSNNCSSSQEGSTTSSSSHHTSSAFSASAQPNEDWTKISDLAERRRIQNRIAQRNYRKKLKRRLEDLERKASASASASPEQRPAELSIKIEKVKAKGNSSSNRRSSPTKGDHQSLHSANSTSTTEEWSMFSSQHTRQVSPSPPPFSFPTLDSFHAPASPQLPSSGYGYSTSQAYDSGYQYHPYMQSYEGIGQYQWQDKPVPIKQENYGDNDISPLNLPSYVPVSSMDMSFASSYTDPSVTPDLCDMYEYSSAGSPSEFHTFPQTPMMVPLSPPFTSFEQ